MAPENLCHSWSRLRLLVREICARPPAAWGRGKADVGCPGTSTVHGSPSSSKRKPDLLGHEESPLGLPRRWSFGLWDSGVPRDRLLAWLRGKKARPGPPVPEHTGRLRIFRSATTRSAPVAVMLGSSDARCSFWLCGWCPVEDVVVTAGWLRLCLGRFVAGMPGRSRCRFPSVCWCWFALHCGCGCGG